MPCPYIESWIQRFSKAIMIGTSITAGFTGIRRRPGLVVLIYAMNLMMAFILSIPVYIALGSTVGGTGFDADLAGSFSIVLWADIIEEAGEALGALQFQLLWMIPLYLIWKAAATFMSSTVGSSSSTAAGTNQTT